MAHAPRSPHPRLDSVWTAVHQPGRLEVVAAVLAVGVVGLWLEVPLVEDSLFWWVPKGLMVAEQGPRLALAGDLPAAMAARLSPETLPPQWAGGLPDYAHPPLWYWWLGAWLAALGPSITTLHLACAPVAAAAAAGWVAVARRLGAPLAGLAPFAVPSVVAQLLRPELDLPLLAVVPWCLVALLSGRWGAFAALSVLAVGVKEPGVLLCGAALLRVAHTRDARHLPHALAPLAALGVWGLLHGGLASAERLPASLGAWLSQDLPAAARLVVWEQGRWMWGLGLGGALWTLRPRDRGPWLVVGGFVGGWLLFFSVVGFRLQPHNPDPLTHVRYFGPGLALLAVLCAQRWPWVVLGGLLFLHARSPYGPEASLFGLDAARAEAASAGWVRAELAAGRRVWVGSYQAAALTQSWAGHGDGVGPGLRVYSAETSPDDLAVGDRVVLAAYGEPAGALLRAWTVDGVREWTSHEATVVAAEVVGRRE